MSQTMQHIRLCAVRLTQAIGLYQLAMKIDTHFRNKRLAKAFQKHGLETLVLASKTLRAAGITFFPTCGTLLGAYREHNFIPYDCDLDAGVLASKDTPLAVKRLLLVAGFEHTQQLYLQDTHQVIEDRFVRLGVQLDIFYYFELAEQYYCYFARPHESKDWREANRTNGFPAHRSYMPKCAFEERDFLGQTFLMPTDTAAWLAGMYGADFMTPLPKWQAGQKKTTTVNEGERIYRK